MSPIKKDLEYTAHHWREPNFEPWEEEMGLHFYNMLAVQCQQHLVQGNIKVHLGKLLGKPSADLVEFLKKKPVPVFDYFEAFESVAMALDTPGRGAEFFSLCLENIEKSCELTPDSELCEMRRTVKATAWKYSEVTHKINYSESIRKDGYRLYSSTGEKLLNKLVLQPPRFVMDFASEFAADSVCKK
jgi:hypothetical protein